MFLIINFVLKNQVHLVHQVNIPSSKVKLLNCSILTYKHVKHAFINRISASFATINLIKSFQPRTLNVVLFSPSRETPGQYVFTHKNI